MITNHAVRSRINARRSALLLFVASAVFYLVGSICFALSHAIPNGTEWIDQAWTWLFIFGPPVALLHGTNFLWWFHGD